MTQTHGPKFRLHEQYLKRAVVTVFPQVSAGHYPEFIALTEVTSPQSPHYSSVLLEVYSVSIYSVFLQHPVSRQCRVTAFSV